MDVQLVRVKVPAAHAAHPHGVEPLGSVHHQLNGHRIQENAGAPAQGTTVTRYTNNQRHTRLFDRLFCYK